MPSAAIPIPVLLDRERIAALNFDIPAQVSVASPTLPLQMSMGSDGSAKLYWSGSIRYAAVSLRNTGGSGVRDMVLLLRSSQGTIEKVYDSRLRWRQTDHGWIAALAELGSGDDIKIVVKYALAGTSGAAAGAHNELRAIVKPREADALEAALSWNSQDCTARFAARLGLLRADPGRDPKQALRLALSREPDLPRRPLFPVNARELGKELAAVLRLAGEFRKTGGVDAKLLSEEYKWLTGRLSRDLKNYLEQQARPAMCAPAGPMLDFLQHRAAPLERRIDALRAQRALWQEHAQGIARQTLGELAMQRVATSDPAFLLPASMPALAMDWQGMIVQLGEAAGMNKQDLAGLRSATSPLQALLHAKGVLEDDPAFAATVVLKPRRPGSKRMVKVKQKNLRAEALRAALGAIERAVYLDLAADRVDMLDTAFIDSLAAIRTASTESCTCAF